MRNFKLKKQQGSMMVEIMVAVSIVTLAILSATGVAQKSLAVAKYSTNDLQAAFLLEEGAEVVRLVRDNDWTNISNLTLDTSYYPEFSGGTWQLSATPNTVGIFTRSIIFSSVLRDSTTQDIVTVGGVEDLGTRLVTVTVVWNQGSETVDRTLSFYITDLF